MMKPFSRRNRIRQIGRRDFLRYGMVGVSAFLGAPLLKGCHPNDPKTFVSNIGNVGPLLPPDANGVMLPAGFSSRIVAVTGTEPVAGSGYPWHSAPDGGATYPTPDGGWIYVSNSERSSGAGGVGALRFDANGGVIDAYPICSGTSRNCAGGKLRGDKWLTCEEESGGQVYECDPFGILPPVFRPLLGRFSHEAVAEETANNHLYLTEDRSSGGFYRFVPDALTIQGFPDLSSGTLQIAEVVGGGLEGFVTWHDIPDPNASSTSTRYQVSASTPFNGGEGIDYHNGTICFVTKGDGRVWSYDVPTQELVVLYDDSTHPTPFLTGLDNLLISSDGDILVAEDGGDLEIVAIVPDGTLVSLVKLSGHGSSEITGPAFDPAHQRLYFSSQRGTTGSSFSGMTFEITGPFRVES
jgi:hypothetical protein